MSSPIFLHYDRAALDAQYDNRAKVPGFPGWVERWAADGERARTAHGLRLDVRYGATPRQSANVFAPAAAGALRPVLVYIHGGYWMAFGKDASDYVALGLVPHDVVVVNVDYDLMPGARMDELVAQCRAAVAWTIANAASFGGDPGNVWVAGHSAGGHLTASVAAGASAGPRPRGGFAVSGLFDLEPIRLSYLNDRLGLDADEAARNAPVRMAPPPDGDWTLWVGGTEGPEYLRHTFDLAAAWASDGARRVRAEVLAGEDHFSVVGPLGDPGSAMVARIVAAMRG